MSSSPPAEHPFLLTRQREVLARHFNKWLYKTPPASAPPAKEGRQAPPTPSAPPPFNQEYWRKWGIVVDSNAIPDDRFVEHCMELIPKLYHFRDKLDNCRILRNTSSRLRVIHCALAIDPVSEEVLRWNYAIQTAEESRNKAMEVQTEAADAALQRDQRVALLAKRKRASSSGNNGMMDVEQDDNHAEQQPQDEEEQQPQDKEEQDEEHREDQQIEQEEQQEQPDEEDEEVPEEPLEIPDELNEEQEEAMAEYVTQFDRNNEAKAIEDSIGVVDVATIKQLGLLVKRLQMMQSKRDAYARQNKEKNITQEKKKQTKKKSKKTIKKKQPPKKGVHRNPKIAPGTKIVPGTSLFEASEQAISMKRELAMFREEGEFDVGFWAQVGLTLPTTINAAIESIPKFAALLGALEFKAENAASEEEKRAHELEQVQAVLRTTDGEKMNVSHQEEWEKQPLMHVSHGRQLSWMQEAKEKRAVLRHCVNLCKDIRARVACLADEGIPYANATDQNTALALSGGIEVSRQTRHQLCAPLYDLAANPEMFDAAFWAQWGILLHDAEDMLSRALRLADSMVSLCECLRSWAAGNRDLVPVLEEFVSIDARSPHLTEHCEVESLSKPLLLTLSNTAPELRAAITNMYFFVATKIDKPLGVRIRGDQHERLLNAEIDNAANALAQVDLLRQRVVALKAQYLQAVQEVKNEADTQTTTTSIEEAPSSSSSSTTTTTTGATTADASSTELPVDDADSSEVSPPPSKRQKINFY